MVLHNTVVNLTLLTGMAIKLWSTNEGNITDTRNRLNRDLFHLVHYPTTNVAISTFNLSKL